MQPQVSLIEKLRKDFVQFQSFLIIASPEESFDSLAASLAIFLSLSKKKKNVSIVSSKEPRVEYSNLVGIDKVKTEVSSGKFIITLKDVLGSVDKVTHYLEDGQLNIVVHPLTGGSPFSKEKVFFKTGEAEVEKIILVGVEDLNLLGSLYSQNRNMYSKNPILSIGTELKNNEIDYEVFERKGHSSLSEVTTIFLNKLGLPIDEDIAENLFLGISSATKNFQSSETSADAFEAAAFCLRCGAKRSVIARELKEQVKEIKKTNLSIPKNDFEEQNEILNQVRSDPKELPDEDLEEQEIPEPEPEDNWLTPPKIYRSSKSS